jgi:hypothetical protein
MYYFPLEDGERGIRLFPTTFCICNPYEEGKEKEPTLQKGDVSSSIPATPCASGRRLIPARREKLAAARGAPPRR